MFGYVNRRDLEKQFNEALTREVHRAEMRVDDALSEIVRVKEEPSIGPDVVFQVRVPRGYANTLMRGGNQQEVTMMVIERVANRILASFSEAIERQRSSYDTIDLKQGADGTYL